MGINQFLTNNITSNNISSINECTQITDFQIGIFETVPVVAFTKSTSYEIMIHICLIVGVCNLLKINVVLLNLFM